MNSNLRLGKQKPPILAKIIFQIMLICAPIGGVSGILAYHAYSANLPPQPASSQIAHTRPEIAASSQTISELKPVQAQSIAMDEAEPADYLSTTSYSDQSNSNHNTETTRANSIAATNPIPNIEFVEQLENERLGDIELLGFLKPKIDNAQTPHGTGSLIIPKLSLASKIVQVPIINGLWATDELGHEVGLLDGAGQFPFDNRSMIFAGHAALRILPTQGPFDRLGDLNIDDEVVYIQGGQTYTYKVSKSQLIEPDDRHALSQNNGEQIILVTCGSYNYLSAEYEKRLLVYADLVSISDTPFN